MSDSFMSASWYRVAGLRPRLRSHAQIHRHHYRGELWYVLQDHASGRFHRFSPMAYFVIGALDGKRSVADIWQSACERFGDDAPGQEDVIGLLAQLHAADVLLSGVPSDTAELIERSNRQERQRRQSRWRSPLAVRIPLLDPDRLLAAVVPFVRWIFGPLGALIWTLLVGAAALQAAMHWPELSNDVTDRVLALENLLLLALIFPVVKLFHELGHGLAVKSWGGEVHEMGIMLLVFVPIPYVDASAASAFRGKRRRMLVGAAGMMAELAIAAVAMFVWLGVQPGLVKAVAFNTMLIAGVSTLLFNGNPLLRFDGYYILMDWLEAPNLAARANRYIGYLIRRYAFGLRDAVPPHATVGEKRWFVPFAVGSFVYRITILTLIILFVASQYFVVGVVLAIWAACTSLLLPFGRALRTLVSDKAIATRRGRAIAVTLASAGTVAALLVLAPVPYRTPAEGVVWIPEESRVTTGVGGFVGQVFAASGSSVAAGDPLLGTADPVLESRVRLLRAEVAELEARYGAAFAADRVAALTLAEELALARERLASALEREAELVVRSPADGIFLLPQLPADLEGQYLERGALVGYVVRPGTPTVRVVVSQQSIDTVRQRTQSVELRLADDYRHVREAKIWSEVPSARTELPSRALTLAGGGRIATDPTAATERSIEPFFEFELVVDAPALPLRYGGRAYVRFAHASEPLAYRWYRSARQLLLEVLSV